MSASASDSLLKGPERLKLDIEEHFVYADDRLVDIDFHGRRVVCVRIVREVIDLLICGPLRVGLPNEGPALQVRNAPGYVFRLVRNRHAHGSGVALRVVLCHAHDTGSEVYPVLVVHDTDDFTRPETGESVPGEPVEVDSPYLIGVIGLRALP